MDGQIGPLREAGRPTARLRGASKRHENGGAQQLYAGVGKGAADTCCGRNANGILAPASDTGASKTSARANNPVPIRSSILDEGLRRSFRNRFLPTLDRGPGGAPKQFFSSPNGALME